MHGKTWSRRDLLLSASAAAAVGVAGQAAAQYSRRPKYIVDSQVHIWSGGKPTPTHRQEPFSKDQLLQEMDTARVDRAIIVTPSWNLGGNELPLEAARAFPERLAVMGLFDISKAPDPAGVENWNKQKGMVGIRMFLGSPQGKAWISNGSADWIWPILERANIPLAIFAGGLLPQLGAVATKYPALRICLDSFGIPPGAVGLPAFADFDSVLAMARLPNVNIKLASLPFLSGEPYPYKNLQPILRRTYDAFGPDRMFFGSDITLLKSPYADCIRAFTDELPWLSDTDLAKIMGLSFSNWIGWPLPA